jgi:ABC-type amino acid transport substrate-binding protein
MRTLSSFLIALTLLAASPPARADDLDDIQAAGVLRHLGVPNGNFVTGAGDGLDVELIQGFARHLGVDCVFVRSEWPQIIGDLTGRKVRQDGDGVEPLGATPVLGDVIAAGMTIQPWRQKVVEFADPTFPANVWLVSLSDSRLKAVAPSGPLLQDIARVRRQLQGVSVLAVANSRLDAARYDLDHTRAEIRTFPSDRDPGELVPALMGGEAEATLLSVPEALAAIERWPGRFKIVGPVSGDLVMAPAFRPRAGRLREAFNAYMADLRADGRYAVLVRKYYPAAPGFYASFFAAKG